VFRGADEGEAADDPEQHDRVEGGRGQTALPFEAGELRRHLAGEDFPETRLPRLALDEFRQ
jgi:hypothetical protein